MGKYTAEQVEVVAGIHEDVRFTDEKNRDKLADKTSAMLRGYAALLRERESAKAGVTNDVAARVAHVLEQAGWATGGDFKEEFLPDVRSALEAVAPMLAMDVNNLASARVLDGGEFERGYIRGYEAALGAAAAECRRQGHALDSGGNEYIRYADAIKCAAAIGALRAPELNELSGNSGELLAAAPKPEKE